MFVEYIILQVCKITDPAQDARKNGNLIVAFLLRRYDFSADPVAKCRLDIIADRLLTFRSA
jgi:hypothetical protein